MSSNANPLPRQMVLPHALRIWDRITPVCVNSCYAGSLRRWLPFVGDIELVAQPTDPDALMECLKPFLEARYLRWDETVKRNGPIYKRFIVPALADEDSPGMAVDLHFADADNYGYRLLISTGNAEWNHYMVTPLSKGGLRPAHIRCADGYVWQKSATGETVKLPTPNERSLFSTWGLNYVEPADRTQETVHEIRRAMGLPYIVLGKKPEAAPTEPTHHRLEAFA